MPQPPFSRLSRRFHAALAAAALALPLALSAAPAATPPAQGKAAAPAAVDAALRQRIEAAPQGVAGLHKKRKGQMDCAACHGDKVAPDDNQTVENRECVACHGGYPEMAAESAKKLTNPALNAHASHLGPEIACTACHQGHQESKAYCVNCHTNFTMPMPGNGNAAKR